VNFARREPEALAHVGDREPHHVCLICHLSRVPRLGDNR
jgi:hypothetical protein